MQQLINILAERALMAAFPCNVHDDTKRIHAAIMQQLAPAAPPVPDNVEQFPQANELS